MRKLAKITRAVVKHGNSFPGTIIEVMNNRASVRISADGSLFRSLEITGGPVEVGQSVIVDFTTEKPTILAAGQSYTSEFEQLLPPGARTESKLPVSSFTQPEYKWYYYSVEWTNASGSADWPSIGDGILDGIFCIIGNICHVLIYWEAGASTTFGLAGSGWRFSLPETVASVTDLDHSAAFSGQALIKDASPSLVYYTRQIWLAQSATYIASFYAMGESITLNTITSSSPFTFASGDFIRMTATYAVA